jgi:hypothetical protein
MTEPKPLDEFLDGKKDYSPFLVHLTKDDESVREENKTIMPANGVLEAILNDKTLKAFNHFCLFSPNLEESKNTSLQDKFKVVCFTETPIDQIHILLTELSGRNFKPKPYGLVFKKEYIRKRKGNPVFYITKEIAKPLWSLYDGEKTAVETCKLLSLVTVCQGGNDWHWEREWRIVGNFNFKELKNVYCGICPEDEMSYFENNYAPIKFISPYWGINKILDKLVKE